MINDEELEHLVNEVDEYLANMCIDNKLDPMSVSGIVLARLALMAKEMDSIGEFLLLLESAKSRIMDSEQFNFQQKKNGTLH
jgi:hypothetical protein